jgi:RHS repeat-associated protein
MRVRAFIVAVSLVAFGYRGVAQAPATGLYPWGTFDSRGFDTINVGNLNMHFEIPIVNKPGRGQGFDYRIVYEGLIWSPSNANGSGTWVPDTDWGFRGQLNGGLVGYITYNSGSTGGCPRPPNYSGPVPGLLSNNFSYHDPYGVTHKFFLSIKSCPMTDEDEGTVTGNGSSSDGSGYVYNRLDGTVRSRTGSIINPTYLGAQNTGSITDSNGNTVSNNGNGTFTDTLGTTPLTIGGGGNASSPRTFTYNVARQSDGSTTATVTMSYHTYTVATNFGCSDPFGNPIGNYGPLQNDLVDRITLADGTYYQFNYEDTPGVAGAKTGRLASVTLPTGGTINYQYSGGCNGNGLNGDGTTGSLYRVTSDGTRRYERSPVNGNATNTTLTDETGSNQTVYQFTITNGSFYETHRQVYQGNVGSTALLDQQTCYNGSTTGCDGAAITLPVTQTQKTSSLNGGGQKQLIDLYNSANGLLTSEKVYDGGALLLTTTYSYVSPGRVSAVESRDASNQLISQITYGYDEGSLTTTSGIPQHNAASGPRGNQTSSHTWINSGGTLNTSTSYYDTGVPVSSSDPNGTTQYGYDPAQAFNTSTTLPTPSSGAILSTSASYDPTSGIALTNTGMNPGETTTFSQYDSRLRPKSITLPNGSVVTMTYTANDTEANQTMGAGASADVHTLVDEYGRMSRTAVFNGNDWYQVDYCNDATGRLRFESMKYHGSGFAGVNATKQCSGSGSTYTYDGLGRVTNINTADGNTTYQYNSRAVKVTDVNGVQKITQTDALGRISVICEVSGTPYQGDSTEDCGLDIAGTGYRTKYDYDLVNHKMTITQGAQQRIFQTDSLGRTVNTKEPERGETSYSYAYNSTGLQVTRTKPKANQGDPNVKTNTVTQYDSIGRPVTATYSDGITPTKLFYYDTNPWVTWASQPTTNLKGHLSIVATYISTTLLTSSLFSYDTMGRVSTMWQCAPSLCGTPNQASRPALQFGYDLAGNLISEFDGVSGQIVYGRSPAGEVTSITNQSYIDTYNPANLVSNVVNGPFGPASYTLGNGLAVVNRYDSMGRNTGNWLCTNGSTQEDCGNNNASTAFLAGGQIGGDRLYWQCDSEMGCHDFPYDDLNRVSVNESFGTVYGTYSYDRYGNRWQQTSPQGGPAPSYSFDTATNHINGLSYDAAGNMTNDGFHSYTYDAEGKILQVDGGASGQYVYDALDRRVRTQNAGATYEYQYDYAGRRISSWLEPMNFGNEGRIYWDGQQIAYRAWNGQTYFEHKDMIGTERMRTNYAGFIASTYQSLPWGDGYGANETSNVGDGLDNLHFAQLDKDSESNTEHAQFRQYSSTQGRWMSPDPYDGSYDFTNPQSFNRYSYVGNNPLSFSDPSGLKRVRMRDDPTLSTYGHGYGGSPPFGSTWGLSDILGAIFAGSWGEQAKVTDAPSGDWLYTIQYFHQSTLGISLLNFIQNPATMVVSTAAPVAPNKPGQMNQKGTLCGGTFNYSGYENSAGVGSTFNGAITEYPTNSAPEAGTLQEISGGEILNFGVGYIQPLNGSKTPSIIDFSGIGIHTPFGGFSVGVIGGNGFVGLYGEYHSGTSAAGGGAYLNTSLCRGH